MANRKTPSEFDAPGGGEEPHENADGAEFSEPSAADLGVDSAQIEAEAQASVYGEDVLALKSEIEAMLVSDASVATESASVQDADRNIVGGASVSRMPMT